MTTIITDWRGRFVVDDDETGYLAS